MQRLEIIGAPAVPERESVVAAAGDQSVFVLELRQMSGVRAIDSVRGWLATHRPVASFVERLSLVAV